MHRLRKYYRLARHTGILLARLLFRAATFKRRVLPNFFVLGAPRSGTSSLDYYVSQHPSYVSPFMKELGYTPADTRRPHGVFHDSLYRHFPERLREPVTLAVQGLYYHGGAEGYRKLFPLASAMRKRQRRTGRAITADYTVLGLYSRATTDGFPYSVASDDTKYIAILRRPIDFLFSFYTMEIHHHFREIDRDVSFEHFVRKPHDFYPGDRGIAARASFERWRPLFEQRPYFKPAEFSIATAMVCYVVFIKEWATKLPKDRFLVLSFSDLRDETRATTDAVFQFLGLPSLELSDIQAKNVGSYEGKSASAEVTSYIEEICRPFNEELYDFLGRDLGW